MRTRRGPTRVRLSLLAVAAVAIALAWPYGPAWAGSSTQAVRPLETVRVLAEMWGHLEASRANAQRGEWALATLHAGHPVVEYWGAVERTLEQVGVAHPVRSALDAYLQSVENRSSTWSTRLEAAVASLQRAMRAVAGAAWEDPAFQGEVLQELVEAVEAEYREAVEGGRLTHLAEYQDAWGFFRVARTLYEPLAQAVKRRSPEAAQEIAHAMDELAKLFARVWPAQAPAPVERVAGAADRIADGLAEAFALSSGPFRRPEQVVAEIRGMMQKALGEYRAGKAREAYEWAANAYLEGFEHIEGDLMRKGHRSLVEELELRFKELRDGIRAGRNPAELESLIRVIESRLDAVLEVLR